MLPDSNATQPTEPPSFAVTPQINGTLLFEWTRPIVQPAGTEFQIIRSTNSANAAVGTVVWRGAANPVPLVSPTSRHWYYVRAVANSAFSPYQPNTFGILGEPRGEADNTDFRTLASDPEIRLSEINGRFWGFERTDCFSLSLTGGQVDGRIVTTATTHEPNDLHIFAMPSTPYVRNITGRSIKMACRWRSLTALSSKGFSVIHAFQIRGWTGVGSPSFSNGNTADAGSELILVPHSANGSFVPQNVYQSASFVGSIGATAVANANSYPYLVSALRVAGAGGPGFLNSGDLFEFDSLNASQL